MLLIQGETSRRVVPLDFHGDWVLPFECAMLSHGLVSPYSNLNVCNQAELLRAA